PELPGPPLPAYLTQHVAPRLCGDFRRPHARSLHAPIDSLRPDAQSPRHARLWRRHPLSPEPRAPNVVAPLPRPAIARVPSGPLLVWPGPPHAPVPRHADP